MKATMVNIKDETHHVKTFVFELEKEVSFEPGQFFMFCKEEEKACKRPYSISSETNANTKVLGITLNLVPEGKFSTLLFNSKVGDEFLVEGPFGKFTYHKEDGDHMVLIAGGTGIAPMRCIMHHALKDNKKVTVVYSVKEGKDLIFKEEFEGLGEKITFIPTVTREDEEWSGRRGRIDEALLKEQMTTGDEAFYLCGNPKMVRELIILLKKLGVSEDKIKREQW